MTTKTVENTPSQTALFAALRRALAYLEFHDQKFGPDHLAAIFLPAHYRFFLRFARVRANTRDKLERFMPGLSAYMVARTAFFDELFVAALRKRVPQVVLLGAGYDSRAHRFAGLNQSTRIYELDAPPTQKRKMKCLRAARVEIPAAVRFVPIDFNREGPAEALEKAGFQPGAGTMWIWEGVSYYLEREAVEAVLGLAGRYAGPDSLIAFDYAVSLSEEELPACYGASEWLKSMRAYHTGEALLFSIPPGQLELFLAGLNLRLVENLDHAAIEKRYLAGQQGAVTGRVTGIFGFACASPRL